MTNEVNVNAPFKVIATTSSRLKDLVIQNGQLVFIQDLCRIAFDFNDKRVFYNQITELETEYERSSISAPTYGYYFVIDTAVLWLYKDGWIRISNPPNPDDVVFIGVELPELGQAKENTLYVNKAVKEISIFDNDSNEYIVVADKTEDVTNNDIENLFN